MDSLMETNMENDMESGVWRGIAYLSARATNVPIKQVMYVLSFGIFTSYLGGLGYSR